MGIKVWLKSTTAGDQLISFLEDIYLDIDIKGDLKSYSFEDIIITEPCLRDNNNYNFDLNKAIFLVDETSSKDFKEREDTLLTILIKPINLEDLKSIIDQKFLTFSKVYYYDKLKLDLNHNELIFNNKRIFLSDKECLILKELFKNVSKSVSKDYFLNKVWNINSQAIDTNSLHSYISFLRKKLSDNMLPFTIIKNKTGYKLQSIAEI